MSKTVLSQTLGTRFSRNEQNDVKQRLGRTLWAPSPLTIHSVKRIVSVKRDDEGNLVMTLSRYGKKIKNM